MSRKFFLLPLLLLTLLPACGSMPQTRAEFTGHPDITKQTYAVARKLDAVVASLDKQAKSCINGSTRTRSGVGGNSVQNTAQYMTVAKTSATRAELTYRLRDNVTVGQPQGGFFQFAADLRAQGAQSTEVTIYHGIWSETLINAVKEWSKGNDNSCHGYGKS